MTDDPFTRAMYGHHVFLSPWDASPVPGGPTFRQIAVARMRAESDPDGTTSSDASKGDESHG